MIVCVCMCVHVGVCAREGALCRQSGIQRTPESVQGISGETETGQPASTSSTDL